MRQITGVTQMENLNSNNVRPLRRNEASEHIKINYGFPCTTQTLAKLAVVGGGPAFRKIGRIPVYLPSDLDTWITSRMSSRVHSTSEL
jgi:hypothetical protein